MINNDILAIVFGPSDENVRKETVACPNAGSTRAAAREMFLSAQ